VRDVLELMSGRRPLGASAACRRGGHEKDAAAREEPTA
jgi:hypothetical protein